MKPVLQIAGVVLFLLFVSGPLRSSVYVIPKIDISYGISEWHKLNIDINPAHGAGIILGYSLFPSLSFEGTASYDYWFMDGGGLSYYHIPFMFGARLSLGYFGIAGGCGGIYRNLSNDVGDETDETVFGYYIGGDIIVKDIMIRVQYIVADNGDEFMRFKSESIKVSFGYRFGF